MYIFQWLFYLVRVWAILWCMSLFTCSNNTMSLLFFVFCFSLVWLSLLSFHFISLQVPYCFIISYFSLRYISQNSRCRKESTTSFTWTTASRLWRDVLNSCRSASFATKRSAMIQWNPINWRSTSPLYTPSSLARRGSFFNWRQTTWRKWGWIRAENFKLSRNR